MCQLGQFCLSFMFLFSCKLSVLKGPLKGFKVKKPRSFGALPPWPPPGVLPLDTPRREWSTRYTSQKFRKFCLNPLAYLLQVSKVLQGLMSRQSWPSPVPRHKPMCAMQASKGTQMHKACYLSMCTVRFLRCRRLSHCTKAINVMPRYQPACSWQASKGAQGLLPAHEHQ